MSELLSVWAHGAYLFALSTREDVAPKSQGGEDASEEEVTFEEKLRVIGSGVFSLPVSCTFAHLSEEMETNYGLVTSHAEDPHQFAEALMFCAVQRKEFGENVMSMGTEILEYVKEVVAVYAEAITYDSTPSTPSKAPHRNDSINEVLSTPSGRKSRPSSISYRKSDAITCVHCLSKDLLLTERLRALNDRYIMEIQDRETIADLKSTVSNLEERHKSLTYKNEQMESTIATLERQTTAYEVQALEQDHKIIDLEKNVFELREAVVAANSGNNDRDNEELTDKIDVLSLEIDDLRAEISRLRKTESELQTLKYDFAQAEKEIVSKQSGLDEAIANMRLAEDEAASLKKQLQAVKEQQSIERTKSAAMEKEFLQLVETHDEHLRKMSKENKDMKSQIEDFLLERSSAAANGGAGTINGKQRRRSILELREDEMDGRSKSDGDNNDENNVGDEDEGGRSKARTRSVEASAANVFAMELELDQLQSENKALKSKLAKTEQELAAARTAFTPNSSPLPSPVVSSVPGSAAASPDSSSSSKDIAVSVTRRRLEHLEKEEATSGAIISALRRDLAHAENLLLRLYESESIDIND